MCQGAFGSSSGYNVLPLLFGTTLGETDLPGVHTNENRESSAYLIRVLSLAKRSWESELAFTVNGTFLDPN